jgi:hypothetical protein
MFRKNDGPLGMTMTQCPWRGVQKLTGARWMEGGILHCAQRSEHCKAQLRFPARNAKNPPPPAIIVIRDFSLHQFSLSTNTKTDVSPATLSLERKEGEGDAKGSLSFCSKSIHYFYLPSPIPHRLNLCSSELMPRAPDPVHNFARIQTTQLLIQLGQPCS